MRIRVGVAVGVQGLGHWVCGNRWGRGEAGVPPTEDPGLIPGWGEERQRGHQSWVGDLGQSGCICFAVMNVLF